MNQILAIPIEVRLAILFVLGCCFGSLINLGIYRLAWHQKSLSPWSLAPKNAPQRHVWDRLPVVGWLGLRREVLVHGRGFWIRPMLIELFCGAAMVVLYLWEVAWCQLVLTQGQVLSPVGLMEPAGIALSAIRHEQFLAHAILFCFMLVAFWIDIDEMTIPDGVTLPGTLLGLFIVSLWPYGLLPQVTATGPFVPQIVRTSEPEQFPVLSSVWLTSPDELPPKPDVPSAWKFVQPWNVPAVTSGSALAAAISSFWIWCLALTPGHWSTRHGYLARCGFSSRGWCANGRPTA